MGPISVWLLEAICGLKLEYRGLDNIPPGAVLIAAKHQSFLETFALLKYAPDFAIILKRQLTYVPLFGLYLIVSQQIAIDRGRGRQALQQIAAGGEDGVRRRTPGLHLPGGNPARARRAAEIQAGRRGSLCRDGRPLPAGRRQYRPVLAASRLPQAARRRSDRISADHRARARPRRLQRAPGSDDRNRLRPPQCGGARERPVAGGGACGGANSDAKAPHSA